MRSARPARITTLPNLLGLARIALTPVVMALILLPFAGGGLLAAMIFAVAALGRARRKSAHPTDSASLN